MTKQQTPRSVRILIVVIGVGLILAGLVLGYILWVASRGSLWVIVPAGMFILGGIRVLFPQWFPHSESEEED